MIRRYFSADHADLVRMMLRLFPQQPREYVTEFINYTLLRPERDAVIIVDERTSPSHDRLCAGFLIAVRRAPFADVSDVRDFGYVEAWYVDEDMRGMGRGEAMLAAAEDWAHANGFREIASDVEHDNRLSQKVHKKCGFATGNHTIHFRKEIG